jgi:hypothetical protein
MSYQSLLRAGLIEPYNQPPTSQPWRERLLLPPALEAGGQSGGEGASTQLT